MSTTLYMPPAPHEHDLPRDGERYGRIERCDGCGKVFRWWWDGDGWACWRRCPRRTLRRLFTEEQP